MHSCNLSGAQNGIGLRRLGILTYMRVNYVVCIWNIWRLRLRSIHLLYIRALIEASLIHDLRMLRLDAVPI